MFVALVAFVKLATGLQLAQEAQMPVPNDGVQYPCSSATSAVWQISPSAWEELQEACHLVGTHNGRYVYLCATSSPGGGFP